MENAHPLDGDPELAASTVSRSSDEEEHVWQVRTGRPGMMRWTQVDKDLDDVLTTAFENGDATCQCEWDGWTYTYDMINFMQISPTGMRRAIRRIPWYEGNPFRY